MKIKLLTSILTIISFQVIAQDITGKDYFFGNNFHFHGYRTDLRMMQHGSTIFQTSDTMVWRIFETFNNTNKFNQRSKNITPKSPILLGIKLSPMLKNFFTAEVPNYSKTYYSYLIPDSSEATVIAMGINENNISDYHYRLVLNDSIEIKKWSPIPGLQMKYGAKAPYGNIGTFKYPGKKLLVEVAHKDSIGIRDGYIIDWSKKINPRIEQIIVRGSSQYGYYGLNLDSLKNLNQANSSNRNINLFEWTFEKNSVNEFDLYFEQHETRPYSIYLIRKTENKKDTISLEWWKIDNHFTISNRFLRDVGQYTLIVQETGQFGVFPKDEVTQFGFNIIEPKIDQKPKGYTFKQILPFILALFVLIALVFIFYRWKVRRKLIKSERDRELLKIQMQGIRSQLNPHFMFNSINSIQNLIQKGDIKSAKNYLVTFSSMTREVLEDSEKELHSLSSELKLINDYLIMEQLRFGFKYKINSSIAIHPDNLDIPVMLLQPFVENAVKHAVSNLMEKGYIEVNVSSSENDVMLEVLDNGKGMDTNQQSSGFGIKLSRKRIEILNRLYSQNQIELTLMDNHPGCKIQIILKDWLS